MPESRVRRAYSITQRQAEWLREQAHQHRTNESAIVRYALDTLMHVRPADLAILLREQGDQQ